MLSELSDKNADIQSIAEKALKDRSLLPELLSGLKLKVSTKSADETTRYNCYKVLKLISQTHGEVLYPEWEYFLGLLDSDNSYYKMSSSNLIASLTSVDTENRFDRIFDKYFNLLDDKSMIVAMYVAANAGQIARAKPELEPRITGKLLDIENTRHPARRKELIKSSIIAAFGDYFPSATDKKKILEFVKKQQNSESPKTRKLAKDFLKKWDNIHQICIIPISRHQIFDNRHPLWNNISNQMLT